jgi:hypothetical protein
MYQLYMLKLCIKFSHKAMKITSSLITAICLLLIACKPEQDDQVTATFDATVQSIGSDCRLPLLDFGSRAVEVDKLIGSTNANKLYYGISLDPANLKVGTSMQVTIRKTSSSEERACATMGPAYPSITVTSSVIK